MDLANLEKMKVVDLRNELQTRGLDSKGVKAVLIERLRAHLERGSGVVLPSPGTPGRRSRRTRSMTKSPSPSPVKKAPEPILETLEEESNSSKVLVEQDVHKEKSSTTEELKEPQEITLAAEKLEENSQNQENDDEVGEEACTKEKVEGENNACEEIEPTNNDVEASVLPSNNSEPLENIENDAEENNPPIEETNHDDGRSEDHEENIQEDSSKDSKSAMERSRSSSPDCREPRNQPQSSEGHEEIVQEELSKDSKSARERSRSFSPDHRECRIQPHSDSFSRSRSPRQKSKPHSRSRTRSRSPKRPSGADSLGSPSKEGEDTSTPEDEPTIEENQFGLSWFDSDLHLRIDPVTFTSAKPMSHDIYALVWSGARTNYGVCEGKVCFEVRLSEETNLNRDHPFRDEPYTKGFRVGFSMPSSNLLLGESENSFAYCESGRKATSGEFEEFAKPFGLDDVIGCYLDLESKPCTIKYTLNGVDLGVAFEFDKAILGEDQALFPHVLTKGYEYEINLADNDNLLVNAERKVRKRRRVKIIEEPEKKDDCKKVDNTIEEGNIKDIEEKKVGKSKLQEESENQEHKDEEVKPADNMEISSEQNVNECANATDEDKNEQLNKTITEDCKGVKNKQNIEEDTAPVEKDIEKKSIKNKVDCGPSPSKRQKLDTTEEDEYDEIHPEPRGHMPLLEQYELIALIPEEKYIPGPQRPESRKECEVILMVGLPGAGKTTWVLNHIKENSDKRYHVIGADALIAKMTIDGAPRESVHKGRFDRIYELCFNVLTSLEEIAVKRRRNFILDQLSSTVEATATIVKKANAYASAQRRKMKGFADFKRIAVVCIPNEEELKRRLADKKEKGHAYTLKESTLNTLQAAFTLPSLEFGWFDDIIFTDLGQDEAKEEVKKYNEKGKKALDDNHSNRDKRQRRENYRPDNRHRQDDRRRYDNRNDNRWNDRRAGGGYYNSGGSGAGYRWVGGGGGGGGGYRNNSGGYRDDRGYGGGRDYDPRSQRFSSGPQNWMQNNRNRYDDRNNRYNSGGGGGGSNRYSSYGGGSRDYRSGGGDNRDHRDRNRGGAGGGSSGANNRRDDHRSGGSSNQRDFRHGHRDIREDSRGGSTAIPSTATAAKYKPTSVAGGNNEGYDKYNNDQHAQANNWSQYQQPSGSVAAQQQQQYWHYDMQGYGNQQQWQSMDPQQQQQWMSWWQQQSNAQQAADGGGTTDANQQYWSQYSYTSSTDAKK